VFQLFFESVPAIQTYAIIALFLFFSLFVGTVIWAIRGDKKYMNYMKELPLEFENQDGEDADDQTNS
jgi:hypothetical protein